MEAAAAAIAVEQATATAVEAGIAYGIAKPSPNVSATFTQIANAVNIPRAYHTLNVIGDQCYIYGGQDEHGNLAGDEFHILRLHSDSPRNDEQPDYRCIPPLSATESGPVPGCRSHHSTIVAGHDIFLFGGQRNGKALHERGRIWKFNTQALTWSTIDVDFASSYPSARFGHWMGVYISDDQAIATAGASQPPSQNETSLDHNDGDTTAPRPSPSQTFIIVHGGFCEADQQLYPDLWCHNVESGTWTELPRYPRDPKVLPVLAVRSDSLYLVDCDDNFQTVVAVLPLASLTASRSKEITPQQQSLTWSVNPQPSNPLNPGPKARQDAICLSISTGSGRHYLLYGMGRAVSANHPELPQTLVSERKALNRLNASSAETFSDLWVYGIPAASKFTPAALKDAVRSSVGLQTPLDSWSEVSIEATESNQVLNDQVSEGKSHPGPRSCFAVDQLDASYTKNPSMLLWGGVDGAGHVASDGWSITFRS